MADPNLYNSSIMNPQGGFAHDTYHQIYAQVGNNEINQQQQPTPSNNHPELTTNGVCKKFIHGKCKQGECCPHPHDKSKIKACEKF